MMKRKLFALLLACAVVSTAMAGCGGSDSSSGGSSGTSQGSVSSARVRSYSSVIQNGSSKPVYCAGNRVFVINDDDTCEIAQVADGIQYNAELAGMNVPSEFRFRANVNSFIETDAFGTNYDQSADIYHWDATDPKAVKESVLYPADMVKGLIAERAVSQGADKAAAEEMTESCIDNMLAGQPFIDGRDGYVYKVLNADIEDQSEAGPVAFSIMTLSRNGDKLSFIPDIRAGAFAVGSGFIYYYDAGYTYDKSTGDVTFDSSKAGLYRAFVDGSNKVALISDMQPNASSDSWAGKMKNTVVNLRLINTELFYIDNSANGSGCLYKLSTDGGKPEQVSAYKCQNYYYDRDGGTLYYIASDAPAGTTVFSRNITTGEEKALFVFEKAFTEGETMGICGDHLYFSNANLYQGLEITTDTAVSSSALSPMGQRYDLNTGEFESLVGYISAADINIGEDGKTTYKGPASVSIEWKKEEPKSTDSDLAAY